MNKETLEEAAFRLYPKLIYGYYPQEDENKEARDTWIKGAKWQEERSYNEEEVIGFSEWCAENYYEWHKHFNNLNGGSGVWYHIDDYEYIEPITSKELFEQFKNK